MWESLHMWLVCEPSPGLRSVEEKDMIATVP